MGYALKPTAVFLTVWLHGAALEAADLPVNRWVKIDEGGAGARVGAAAFWMPRQEKFLVAGGITRVAPGGRTPYEIQTFDPATRRWHSEFPRGKEPAWDGGDGASKAPVHPGPNNSNAYVRFTDAEGHRRLEPETLLGGYAAFDEDASQLYVCLSGHRPGTAGDFQRRSGPEVTVEMR
jgi:hypothetical protein